MVTFRDLCEVKKPKMGYLRGKLLRPAMPTSNGDEQDAWYDNAQACFGPVKRGDWLFYRDRDGEGWALYQVKLKDRSVHSGNHFVMVDCVDSSGGTIFHAFAYPGTHVLDPVNWGDAAVYLHHEDPRHLQTFRARF